MEVDACVGKNVAGVVNVEAGDAEAVGDSGTSFAQGNNSIE